MLVSGFYYLLFFREGYKLFTVAFKSLTTGKNELGGLLFLSAEDHDKVRTGLGFFKESLPYTQAQNGGQFLFLVDKDFEYIPVFKEVITLVLDLLIKGLC